ncbi:MAG: NhaA family Na+:H+ antiporter, partial [Myxococcota bacterium]
MVASLIAANMNEHWYHQIVHFPVFGSGVALFGHEITFHFLVNDIFMVLFFGVAAKEITESVLPGGDLNPPSKAINPLFATIGGVVGPVGVYLALTWLAYGGTAEYSAVANGWGIPTATDIALAWLVARIVFGGSHPAVNYLLLLAVADDAIGLGIIAVFYPDPAHPVQVQWLGLVAAGMGAAWYLRKKNVQSWLPYVAFGGTLAWTGLILASLHPALALVVIVPFMPAPSRDTGLFADSEAKDEHGHDGHSPLHAFEHDTKTFVDFGLFFFAFANAGVAFGAINTVTWIVLCSLVIGKTVGIFVFSAMATKLGSPLPAGMDNRHLIVAGLIASLG